MSATIATESDTDSALPEIVAHEDARPAGISRQSDCPLGVDSIKSTLSKDRVHVSDVTTVQVPRQRAACVKSEKRAASSSLASGAARHAAEILVS